MARIATLMLAAIFPLGILATPSLTTRGTDPVATIAALQTEVAQLQEPEAAEEPTPTTSTEQRSESEDAERTQQVNVELILDVSGSMAQSLDTGETRMDAAKRVLDDVIAQIPDRDGINVGLRIYGHEGDNTEVGSIVSCPATDLVVPVDTVDKEALSDEINALQPTGWTPIALSLERAEEDFPEADEDVTNVIVLLTDGLETCGGDPAAVAEELQEGDRELFTNVIGFAVTGEEQQLLAGIADAGAGQLLGASNAAELSTALFTVLEELEIVAGTGFVGGNAFSVVPAGESGDVSVVVAGSLETSTFGSVPFVVRNNTAEEVTSVKVTGTLRDTDDRVVGVSNSIVLTPNRVAAGGLTFGNAYFGDVDIPPDASLEFSVEATPADEDRFNSFRDLDVTEASIFENRIVGTLTNTQDDSIRGPIAVQAVCFDLDGNLLSLAPGTADVGTVEPEETVPFQVTLFFGATGPACPAFLVAGYSFQA